MNCNSNTMPLINISEQASCNNGCTPKDINIICKTIVIPTGQEILGVKGENNSSVRYFILPRVNENGDDLSDKEFSIIIINGNQSRNEIKIENPEILDNYIKLKLIINSSITQNSGELKLQIQAVSDNYVWKTFPATFKIVDSL